MKLWQAMLIGCDRREQEFGALFTGEIKVGQTGECKSCALGAAFEGRFNRIAPVDDDEDMLQTLWAEYAVLDVRVPHPEFGPEGGRDDLLENIIVELNDQFHWTRERIALEVVKPLEEGEDL